MLACSLPIFPAQSVWPQTLLSVYSITTPYTILPPMPMNGPFQTTHVAQTTVVLKQTTQTGLAAAVECQQFGLSAHTAAAVETVLFLFQQTTPTPSLPYLLDTHAGTPLIINVANPTILSQMLQIILLYCQAHQAITTGL